MTRYSNAAVSSDGCMQLKTKIQGVKEKVTGFKGV
jgi:hypothetical protein